MIGFALRTLALNGARRFDPARLARVQGRRLRALVRLAVERSPFYREKYRGIDLDRFDLADLPPTNKGELMANFDRAVTDPSVRRADLERFVDDPANVGSLFQGRFAASHTSGSQGQPLLMVQDRKLLELFFGLQMTRGHARKTNPIEAARRLLRPARVAVVTLKRGFYPSAVSFQHMPAPVGRFMNLLWVSQTDPDVIDRLNAFRPEVLTAYAGVLESLAQEAEAGRLRLAPALHQVVNNSEALTDRARARVEAAFGPHVMNNYATGECPFLTNGCPTDPGAHVNADWAILEVVDDAYRPVPPGVAGRRVLITNLANALQPYIRYEVGDEVTMAAGPCRCGSRLPRVERIDGRAADVFWVQDGPRPRRLSANVFQLAFHHTREVRAWQAVQHERNRILLRIELLPGAAFDESHARRALDHQLELYGFRGLIRVDWEVVPRLAADPRTGKFRRILSLVGPPDDAPTAEVRIDPPGPPLAPPRVLADPSRQVQGS
jgi:phenylacetate-CoA ligase